MLGWSKSTGPGRCTSSKPAACKSFLKSYPKLHHNRQLLAPTPSATSHLLLSLNSSSCSCRRPSTRANFMPSSQPGKQQGVESQAPSGAVSDEHDASGQLTPVGKEDHWTTLLTTMPGLNVKGWCGRLGEFITHTGPSTHPSAVSSSGAILHLWKAQLEPSPPASDTDEDKTPPSKLEKQARGAPSAAAQVPDSSAGKSSGKSVERTAGRSADRDMKGRPGGEVQLPDAVAIRYFTANGVKVTGTGAEGEGAAGADADRALSADGSHIMWDQQLLAAQPTSFVFSPDAPQLSLTLAGWQSQVPVLYRVLRLLPLCSSGLAITNAALPPSWGPDLAEQQPSGSYWFFEVLLTHPDAAGDWQASTLGVAYDWSSGKLSSHRYSWQKAAEPLEQPDDNLARVLLKTVIPPARNRAASLSSLLAKLSGSNLQCSSTTYAYSTDEQQQLMCCHSDSLGTLDLDPLMTAALPQPPKAAAAAAAEEEAGGQAEQAFEDVDGCVTLWFPHGGVYARLPVQLPGGEGGEGGEVVFEVGALHGNGNGMSRCLLVYDAAGERRLRQVQNDEYVQMQPDGSG